MVNKNSKESLISLTWEIPPTFKYRTRAVIIINNANLYYYTNNNLNLINVVDSCGKVCLSLLGTWEGQQGEQWNDTTSTILQVSGVGTRQTGDSPT